MKNDFSIKMSVSRIQTLASIISTETAVIDAHIQSKGLAQPSFDAEGPLEPVQESTAEVERARTAAIEASIELRQLLEGPVKALLPEVMDLTSSSVEYI